MPLGGTSFGLFVFTFKPVLTSKFSTPTSKACAVPVDSSGNHLILREGLPLTNFSLSRSSLHVFFFCCCRNIRVFSLRSRFRILEMERH